MSWQDTLWQWGQGFSQILDQNSATQWYAQQANNALGSANPSNWGWNATVATFSDLTGGVIAAFTGSPATAGQAWAAVGVNVASFGVGLAAKVPLALEMFSTFQATMPALTLSTQALRGYPEI